MALHRRHHRRSAGTAAGGVVIEHAGVPTAFACAAAALGGAAFVALLAQRPWARAGSDLTDRPEPAREPPG